MGKVRKHRDINFVTTVKRTDCLVPESNYQTFFLSKSISKMNKKKTQTLMNKPVYLSLSILKLSKIVMYEFWCGYIKPKCGEKAKLCYMETGSFIIYIKTDNIYQDIAEEIEARFDNPNYELYRSLPTGNNEKVIGLIRDKLGGKIMKEFLE